MIGEQRKGLTKKIEELIAAENSVVTWETIDKSCITSYGHSFEALSAEEAVDLWNRLKKYEKDVEKITAEASA